MWESVRFERGSLPLTDFTSVTLAVVGYLVLVGWLKEYMKTRKRLELKTFIFVHNAFLCLLSLSMFVGIIYEMFFIVKGSVLLKLIAC